MFTTTEKVQFTPMRISDGAKDIRGEIKVNDNWYDIVIIDVAGIVDIDVAVQDPRLVVDLYTPERRDVSLMKDP